MQGVLVGTGRHEGGWTERGAGPSKMERTPPPFPPRYRRLGPRVTAAQCAAWPSAAEGSALSPFELHLAAHPRLLEAHVQALGHAAQVGAPVCLGAGCCSSCAEPWLQLGVLSLRLCPWGADRSTHPIVTQAIDGWLTLRSVHVTANLRAPLALLLCDPMHAPLPPAHTPTDTRPQALEQQQQLSAAAEIFFQVRPLPAWLTRCRLALCLSPFCPCGCSGAWWWLSCVLLRVQWGEVRLAAPAAPTKCLSFITAHGGAHTALPLPSACPARPNLAQPPSAVVWQRAGGAGVR